MQEKYELHDCYVYVDLTPELIQYWENFIINTMKMIRDKEATYAELKAAGKYDEADKLWWEDEESLKKQSYYLTNLCGYSTKLYKPLKAYLDAQDAKKNGDISVVSTVDTKVFAVRPFYGKVCTEVTGD